MTKTRVGVMRGGISSEYDVSLKTGGNILRHIPKDKYDVFDVPITKDKQWHMNGFPTTPDKLSKNIDVIFNALHGEYGEDGKVQKELERYAIPYTGSTTFASTIAMNKALAKYYFKQAGIKTPECAIIKHDEDIINSALRAFRKILGPYLVKPISSGSSVGISIAKDFAELTDAVKYALQFNQTVLVEEYIKGREITCGVIDGLDKNEPYAIYPIEIIQPEGSEFFDFNLKYNGGTTRMCPANLLSETMEKIQRSAIMAHMSLGLRHYSRSDFILSKRGLYILETNSLPGLMEDSLFPTALNSSGLEFPGFLDHIINLTINKK